MNPKPTTKPAPQASGRKGYYAAQFFRTTANKARRAKQRATFSDRRSLWREGREIAHLAALNRHEKGIQ
jgi:hypothetical protein